MTKLTKMNIKTFLDELASNSPAPGGGSVAALSGALAAALTSMVCNLTIGKQGYESVETEIQEVLQKSESLRKHLTELIEKDTDAFNDVMTALKMPKETDEEKKIRQSTMQTSFKHAAQIPLETARTCTQVFDIAHIIAEKGNKNSISDAAVAVLMAQAGVQAAVMNVRINLNSIKDTEFVSRVSSEVDKLLQTSMEKTTETLNIIQKTL
jgi:methenyltetrahydrofolate cyclohydrolase